MLQEGAVRQGETQAFADCLLDGFDKSHFMLTSVTARQQRRVDSYRIETLSGGRLLLVSADVFDDGRTRLLESKAAAAVNTVGEREAYSACLAKFSR